MKTQDKIKVAIVGAGKIGVTGYVNNNIDSYYKALTRYGSFDIKLFDKDETKGDPNFALNSDKFDVIVVSVNTEHHYDIYAQAVAKNPKLIILEKPAGGSLEEFNKIRALGYDRTIVNYIRRLNGDLDNVKNLIKTGAIGDTLHIEGMYNKSVEINGCHFIDSVVYLYGPPMNHTRTDKLITLEYPGFNCNFVRVDASDYIEQHVHIYGSKSKIEINQGGLEQRLYEKMKHAAGYTSLTHCFTYIGSIHDGCEHIPELIIKNINNKGDKVPSSLNDAYHTVKIMYE